MTKTFIILDPEAPGVSDAKVMEYVRASIGSTVRVSSGLVFDGFRLLRVLDEIDHLTIQHTDGQVTTVDHYGVEAMPYESDEVLDVHMQIVSSLIKGGLEKRIAEQNKNTLI